MSELKVPVWLAVGAGGDAVRLLPMEAATGPDVFCKVLDAKEALKQARRKMLLDLWDALPGHEASGDCAGSLRAMLLFSEVGDEIRETRLKSGQA